MEHPLVLPGDCMGRETDTWLIKYGSSLVSFVNKFPKNTRLYKLLTTKPGEDNANWNRMQQAKQKNSN